MTRRVKGQRNTGHARRFVCVAYVGPNGFSRLTYAVGTKTFDTIWRDAPTECSHIVLQFGPDRWMVTDRFVATLLPDARVKLGAVREFPTMDAAIMAAILMAGQGNERKDFARLCLDRFDTAYGATAARLAEAYAETYRLSQMV